MKIKYFVTGPLSYRKLSIDLQSKIILNVFYFIFIYVMVRGMSALEKKTDGHSFSVEEILGYHSDVMMQWLSPLHNLIRYKS